MSKKPPRLSLAGLVKGESPPNEALQRDTVVTAQRDNGTITRAPKATKNPPHLSVYVGREVNKALKEIALTLDCKPHDLMVEGIRRVLAEHGKDFDALNAKG